jgi:DNA-directed RNA polymerase
VIRFHSGAIFLTFIILILIILLSLLFYSPLLENISLNYLLLNLTNILDYIANHCYSSPLHPLSVKESLRKTEKVLLESFYSKRDLEKNVLGLAEIFKHVQEFYMPVRLDYRGRINVMTEYLKYQGSELAKALLLFSKGEWVKITDTSSINYLKIFGANSFGNKIKKLSFFDRVKWVEDNEDNIINFENGTLISKAEDKLLFISFCFEYNNYLNALKNNSPYFVTHLPIQLDATCNGLNL